MLTPKSRDWNRLESRRKELRKALLERPLSELEMAELEGVTAALNQAFDAAFPTMRPRPAAYHESPPV